MTDQEKLAIKTDLKNIKEFVNAPYFHSKQQLRKAAERLIQLCEELLKQ